MSWSQSWCSLFLSLSTLHSPIRVQCIQHHFLLKYWSKLAIQCVTRMCVVSLILRLFELDDAESNMWREEGGEHLWASWVFSTGTIATNDNKQVMGGRTIQSIIEIDLTGRTRLDNTCSRCHHPLCEAPIGRSLTNRALSLRLSGIIFLQPNSSLSDAETEHQFIPFWKEMPYEEFSATDCVNLLRNCSP